MVSRSRKLAGHSYFTLGLICLLAYFLLFPVGPGFSQEQKPAEDFIKILGEANTYYASQNYEVALIKFSEALDVLRASTPKAKYKTRIWSTLTMVADCYFQLGDPASARAAFLECLQLKPDEEPNWETLSPGVEPLFREAKAEYEASLPQEPNAAQTEDAADQIVEQDEPDLQEAKPEVLTKEAEVGGAKRTGGRVLLIGGAVILVGVVAFLVLRKGSGDIHIVTTPKGARVYLDEATAVAGVTDCTLRGVHAGEHSIKLDREGYQSLTVNVTVESGKTAEIDAALNKYSLTINSPAANETWHFYETKTIRWTVSSNSFGRGFFVTSGASQSAGSLTDEEMDAPNDMSSGATAPTQNEGAQPAARVQRDRARPGMVTGRGGLMQNNALVGDGRHFQNVTGPAWKNRFRPFSPSSSLAFRQGGALSSPLTQVQSLSAGPMPLFIDKLNIGLYRGGNQKLSIAAGVQNTGGVNWTIPNVPRGSDYRIRISCVGDPSVYWESAKFAITTR